MAPAVAVVLGILYGSPTVGVVAPWVPAVIQVESIIGTVFKATGAVCSIENDIGEIVTQKKDSPIKTIFDGANKACKGALFVINPINQVHTLIELGKPMTVTPTYSPSSTHKKNQR